MMWQWEAKWAEFIAACLCSHVEDINSWDVFLHSPAWPHDEGQFRGKLLSVFTTKPLKPLGFRSGLSSLSSLRRLSTPLLFFFHFASKDLLILHLCNSPLITGESSLLPRGFWEAPPAWLQVLHCIFHSLKVWVEVYTAVLVYVFLLIKTWPTQLLTHLAEEASIKLDYNWLLH